MRGVYYSSDGEPLWQYRPYAYDAWQIIGDPGTPNSSLNRHLTGHFYNRPTGLYLAPYRAYDPETGRWLSREPLGLDGLNLYRYVFNDPVNYVDPDGLDATGDAAVAMLSAYYRRRSRNCRRDKGRRYIL